MRDSLSCSQTGNPLSLTRVGSVLEQLVPGHPQSPFSMTDFNFAKLLREANEYGDLTCHNPTTTGE